MKKQLNKLVGEFVSVHNINNMNYVFIVHGWLKKEGNSFVVREGSGYVSFNECKHIRTLEGSVIPQIWI